MFIDAIAIISQNLCTFTPQNYNKHWYGFYFYHTGYTDIYLCF